MKHNKTTYNAVNKVTTFHFEDGYTMKLWNNTTRSWYLNGRLHREDGPAVIRHDGIKYWFLNGKRHREDGPALIRADGSKEWWLNGKHQQQ